MTERADHDSDSASLRHAGHVVAGSRTRIATAILTHSVVDFFSFIVVPLLSVLEGRVHLTPGQGATVLMVGSISSGLIQPLVAMLSDKFDVRWPGTLGFAFAVAAIGSVGWAETFGQLLVLQIIGAAGIGAFHPVAAAAVGHLAGRRRSMAMAWFYAAGMVGGFAGNLFAPPYVRHFGFHVGEHDSAAAGLRALVWLIPPGMLFVFALAMAIHSIPHRHARAHAEHGELPAAERRARWRDVALLYVGNVLRFTVDMCFIQLMVRWSEQIVLARAGVSRAAGLTEVLQVEASAVNGPLQAAKQVGMGIGGLALGFLIHPRHEKLTMVLSPLLGAGLIVVLPYFPGDSALGLAMCAVAGLGYGSTIPMTISLAQRLLPHRTSLASSLMMGGAWTFASFGPLGAQYLYDSFGLYTAFAVVAGILALSGAVGLMLRTVRF